MRGWSTSVVAVRLIEVQLKPRGIKGQRFKGKAEIKFVNGGEKSPVALLL